MNSGEACKKGVNADCFSATSQDFEAADDDARMQIVMFEVCACIVLGFLIHCRSKKLLQALEDVEASLKATSILNELFAREEYQCAIVIAMVSA